MRALWVVVPLALTLLLTGCHSLGYYVQAVQGHVQVIRREKPIAKLLAHPQTSEPLQRQLRQLLALRDFAEKSLHLPVNGHYQEYADLGRPFVVWNVFAAPEFSVEPKTWWYPFVGRLDYQGYFREKQARRYALELAEAGHDTYVGGSQAYSTLGWFRDPVLNTFVMAPEADLADLLFHELAHQRLFLTGDADFNEAFATTVAAEGVRRWLGQHGQGEALTRYEQNRKRAAEFVACMLQGRTELAQLYRARAAAAKVDAEARAALRRAKQDLFGQLRRDYAAMKASWGGATDYDAWMALPLNNAQLNSLDTYYGLAPGFRALLDQQQGDLGKFYAAAEAMKTWRKTERHARLRALGGSPP